MNKLNKILLILSLIPKLGLWNVMYMTWYKSSLKFGIRKKWFPIGKSISGEFYNSTTQKAINYKEEWKIDLIENADKILSGKFTWFSYHQYTMGPIPNWFHNPFDKSTLNHPEKHWTELSDFDLNTGDIKLIWELSRFDWVTILARAYKVTLTPKYLQRINELLNDWSNKNPLNQGPNWKCGQETSIRLMKLLSSALILDQYHNSTEQLQQMVLQHIERIVPNINYAIAQDNNHGTSEAAGMYIGASWLMLNGNKDSRLKKWKQRGREILEERILHLIQKDGNFSQRSVTYHRVMVDTMTFVLSQMQWLEEPSFTEKINVRLTKLGEWQFKMTVGENGDSPNYGSNDGAMFNNLHSKDYRDFRPSTQSYFAALLKKCVYQNESVNESMYWHSGDTSFDFPEYEIELPEEELLDNQILILRKAETTVFLKIPEATFRPGNDALHIDLWKDGKNILKDNGSYSYNEKILSDQFKSVASHNTVQFGDHEQMPKISRFLNGNWISASSIDKLSNSDSLKWKVAYKDYKGNNHKRVIELRDDFLLIEDEVSTAEKAIIHFHIDSQFMDGIEDKETYQQEVSHNSLYYLQKSENVLLKKEVTGKHKFKIVFTENSVLNSSFASENSAYEL